MFLITKFKNLSLFVICCLFAFVLLMQHALYTNTQKSHSIDIYSNSYALNEDKQNTNLQPLNIAKPIERSINLSKNFVDNPKIASLPIVPPRVIYSLKPIYPNTALKNGIEGVVVVSTVIGFLGEIQNLYVKSSSGNIDLDNAALDAVKNFRFYPAIQGKNAIISMIEIPIRFTMEFKEIDSI